MTKPWIVHVITKLELGGAQQNTLDTCLLLDRSRFRVALLAGPDGALDPIAARMPNLDFRIVADLVREVSPRRDLRAWKQLRDHVRSFASDGAPVLVHTHSSKAGILGRLAARSASATRIVHTVHGFGHPAFTTGFAQRAGIAAERYVAKFTDRFVVVSEANHAEGNALALFANKPVDLIRSGFDVQEFAEPGITRTQARRDLDLPDDALVVGVIAAFKPQKAVADFLGAFARVHARQKQAIALVVGNGPMRADLEHSRERLGLTHCVRFLGWRNDVPRILRALDAFALTSRWEGLPRSVVQAMAARVPVVATAADGTKDIVKDGKTGVLCNLGDIEAIAAGLLHVLEDRTFATSLVDEASRLVPEFEVRSMVERLEALYEQEFAARRTR